MKKFTIALSREYIVEIEAETEEEATHFAGQFVSGGEDASTSATREKYNFTICDIKPTLNDTICVDTSDTK